MINAQAIVIVDPHNTTLQYSKWKEECFDSVRDAGFDICQTEFIPNNVLQARRIGVLKSKATYIAMIDSDDYIDLNYLEQMLSNNNINTHILYSLEKWVYNNKIIESPANKMIPTQKNVLSFTPLGHHPFGRRDLFVNIFNKIPKYNIVTRAEVKIFKREAICQGINFNKVNTYYYWRKHPNQITSI